MKNQLSKLAMGLTLILNISSANAGYNGSYVSCASKDGSTEILINDEDDISVTFLVGQSATFLSAMVDNVLCEVNDCEGTPEVKNPELDFALTEKGLTVTNLETSQTTFAISSADAKAEGFNGTYSVTGINPQNKQPIAKPIIVKCERIENPI